MKTLNGDRKRKINFCNCLISLDFYSALFTFDAFETYKNLTRND